MDLVSLGDGQVEANNGESVGLGNSEGRVQARDEVRHLVECDELSGVRVEPGNNKVWTPE